MLALIFYHYNKKLKVKNNFPYIYIVIFGQPCSFTSMNGLVSQQKKNFCKDKIPLIDRSAPHHMQL